MMIHDATSFGESISAAFIGVKDAIAGGDWGLAAEIALAGVELEFEKCVAGLKSVWIEFKYFFIKLWDDMVAATRIAIGAIFKAVRDLVGNKAFKAIINATPAGLGLKHLAGVDAGDLMNEALVDRDHVGEANAKDRERNAAKMNELGDAAQRAADKLKGLEDAQADRLRQAEDARLNAELLAAEQAAAAGDKIARAADQAGTSAGTVKGAFATSANSQTFAYADSTKDIATNTKRTAEGVEDLARAIENGVPVWSA
jgi:hypothetical protein